jgi:hypothetical protein
MSKLAAVLAKAECSIFTMSTYDTDYVLVKKSNIDVAIAALRAAGYRVQDSESDL